MSQLRLGAYNLPLAEIALIKTLIRLFAHSETFRWEFASAPPYDAVLVDATVADSVSADIPRMAKAVLRLTRRNSASGPDTLERPIRAERLQGWLLATEKRLLSLRGATPSETRAPAAFPQGVRLKLKRWPAHLLLRGDASRIRIATLLSRRALTVDEVSLLCQQPVTDCEIFLQVLRAANLLEMQREPSSLQGQGQAAASDFTPKARISRGLISSIRRRLGL